MFIHSTQPLQLLHLRNRAPKFVTRSREVTAHCEIRLRGWRSVLFSSSVSDVAVVTTGPNILPALPVIRAGDPLAAAKLSIATRKTQEH